MAAVIFKIGGKIKGRERMYIIVAGNRKEVKEGLTLSELMEQEQVEMPE